MSNDHAPKKTKVKAKPKTSRETRAKTAPPAPRKPRHKSLHACDREISRRYPGHAQARDGEHWTCSCGRCFVHVCDEAEGCTWVLNNRAAPDQDARRSRSP